MPRQDAEYLEQIENAELRETIRQLRETLAKALDFIEGFEDDESQDGITELLEEIRSAL